MVENTDKSEYKDEVLQRTSSFIKKQTGFSTDQKTWVHPRVAIDIAYSMSSEFACSVTGWVQQLLTTGKVELEGKYQELEGKCQELEDKCVTLERRRFLTKEKSIKVLERIVELGFISPMQRTYIYHVDILQNGKYRSKIEHPHCGVFTNKLSTISKCLSGYKKNFMGKNPDISYGSRRNHYSLSDYENWGDEILSDYMLNNPIDSWAIDWTWGNSLESVYHRVNQETDISNEDCDLFEDNE